MRVMVKVMRREHGQMALQSGMSIMDSVQAMTLRPHRERRRRPSYGAGMKRANSASLGWGANAHDVNHFRLMRAAAAAGLGSEGVRVVPRSRTVRHVLPIMS